MRTAHRRKRTGGRRWTSLAASLALLTLSGGCSNILDVDLPGRVSDSDLENASLAQILVDGVIGDLECAWNNYNGASSHHSDEYLPTSGNLNLRNWGARKITDADVVMGQGECDNVWGIYTPLHTARFQAEVVFSRLEAFDVADVPDKVNMQGIVRADGAYALVALGEGWCSMALDGGPVITPAEVLQIAESRFTDAINLTTEADIGTMARVGRARVRLDLGDFTGAIDDASLVPAGFLFQIDRGPEEWRRWNLPAVVLNADGIGFFMDGTIPGNYHNLTVDAQGLHTQNSGTIDPRLIISTTGILAGDQSSEHFFHDKWSARDDPLPLATYKEAQLIVAEAAARSNDLPTARTIINDRHNLAGLPPFDVGATATQDEMIAHVISERRRELAFEAGHRLNDMLRFRGTQFEIPFLGDPGSFHPNGLDQNGDTYGTTTCFPLPVVETGG